MAEDRRKEIQKATMVCLLEKGYKGTTMEDVIVASGMSRGGVYHHYKNTSEILYDIIMEGNKYRIDTTMKKLDEYEKDNPNQIMAQIVTDKIIDNNEYKSIYAMFLLEITKDEKLKSLHKKIKSNSIKQMFEQSESEDVKQCNELIDDFLIVMTNALVLGFEFLGEKELFQSKKKEIEKMLKHYIDGICL